MRFTAMMPTAIIARMALNESSHPTRSTASTPSAAARQPGTTPPGHGRTSEGSGRLQMVMGGLLLGTLGVFVEEAGQDPLTTVWFRCAFGAMALMAYGLLSGRLPELRLPRRGWMLACLSALLMVLNWALFFAAIRRTSIAVATVVFHVQPLWVMALGAWCLGERMPRRQVAAALVALGGLALATGLPATGLSTGSGQQGSYFAGLLMCLGGSLSYAGVTLLARVAAGHASPFAMAWWQCTVGMVVLAWWPWLVGWPQPGASWAWLAGLGAIHTGLAYVLLFGGMARLPAAQTAVLQFVYPAAAILVDWLVYDRALGAVQMAGVLLMGTALHGARAGLPPR